MAVNKAYMCVDMYICMLYMHGMDVHVEHNIMHVVLYMHIVHMHVVHAYRTYAWHGYA